MALIFSSACGSRLGSSSWTGTGPLLAGVPVFFFSVSKFFSRERVSASGLLADSWSKPASQSETKVFLRTFWRHTAGIAEVFNWPLERAYSAHSVTRRPLAERLNRHQSS